MSQCAAKLKPAGVSTLTPVPYCQERLIQLCGILAYTTVMEVSQC